MRRASKILLCLCMMLMCSRPAHSQTGSTSSASSSASAPPSGGSPDCFNGVARDFQDRFAETPPNRAMALNDIRDLSVFICYFSTASIRAVFLAHAEENRLDKQPGATSNSSGATSLTSKGSSPWLLGAALEHGGLTQSTNGNTITLRGNVANSIRAMLNSTYLGSYQLGEKDPLVQGLAKLSFGVSFDTSSNQPSVTQGFTPSKNNFSGFSAKYELINRRDPRNRKWNANWASLAPEALDLAASFSGLNDAAKS